MEQFEGHLAPVCSIICWAFIYRENTKPNTATAAFAFMFFNCIGAVPTCRDRQREKACSNVVVCSSDFACRRSDAVVPSRISVHRKTTLCVIARNNALVAATWPKEGRCDAPRFSAPYYKRSGGSHASKERRCNAPCRVPVRHMTTLETPLATTLWWLPHVPHGNLTHCRSQRRCIGSHICHTATLLAAAHNGAVVAPTCVSFQCAARQLYTLLLRTTLWWLLHAPKALCCNSPRSSTSHGNFMRRRSQQCCGGPTRGEGASLRRAAAISDTSATLCQLFREDVSI